MTANNPSDTDANEVEPSSLVWGTCSFEPGADVGLVSRYTIGLVERDNPSTRDRLWRLVADESPLDDILDELSSTGLKALPDFGVAQVEGDAVRVVARGRSTITAELASGDRREIDPSGVRTWIEEVIADVVELTIALVPRDDDDVSASSGEAFAVLAGSVPARSLTRRFDVADPHADEAIAGWTAESAPVAVSDAVEAVEPEVVEPVTDDAGEAEAWSADESPAAGVPLRPEDRADVPASARPPGPPADARPASPQPAGPPVIGGLSAESLDFGPSGPPPSGAGGGAVPPEATVVDHADTSARGPVTSIFDDEGSADPVIPTLASGEPDAGSDVDAGDTAAPGATVVHGVLAFSNGERIDVDRSVLIGRNPKFVGSVEDGLPHIMKYEGPGQGLSRTHAEVRVENGEMLLEDLQSTNGTEIQLPGQQRRRLRAGEPVVVVPGTLIDFGDELHCTVETAG
jgi:hypothetical protein